jgi:NAD+ diphosphatase
VTRDGFSADYAFRAAGLDRASELREDPTALAAHWQAQGTQVLLLRADGRVLLDATLRLQAASPAELAPEHAERASFLGLRGAAALFSLVLDEESAGARLAAGARFADLRGAAANLAAADAGLVAYARALAHWQSRKRWCGVCGAPTRFTHAGHRAECSDPACAASYFPRTDPAIIVIVACGTQCLLGRQPGWPPGRYSTLAGFVEPGETLEQAVAREVAEESGVHIDHCRYLASQPWPFPASLMLGFEAEATLQVPRVGSELADARWFEAARMPELIASGELALPPAMSISYHLIEHWYRRHGGPALAPGQPLAAR